IEQIKQVVGDVPLLAQPNAGWPERYHERLLYPASPDYFAEYARRFLQLGVTVVGGCCGTTPDHIRAMRRAVDAFLAGGIAPRPEPWSDLAPLEPEPQPIQVAIGPTQLEQKLRDGQFVISVEMDPPKSFNPERLLAGARLLQQAGADVINVADSPRARLRMSPWAVAHLIQAQVGIETVLHFPTRGRNLLRVQSDLLAAHALGVRNIFVVMGDPPSIGDYPQATDAYDVVPSGLVKLIKQRFNQGKDQAGEPIGQPTAFFVGVALDMDAPDLKRQVRVLRRKVRAGADFAITQPIYDVAVLKRFIEEFGPPPIPVLIGILPLRNIRHAEFLHNEVPGIRVPEEVRQRMREADDPAGEGIRIAQEIARAVRELSQGVYIMPPFGRYSIAAQVIAALR
ncbi:MAG: methylenetetrahydrofolate reductase, partial [Anaerolineae bacterium]|nr:methylenetetrahydrofolate reductase [Anaerolineae bacterium]